MTTGEAPPSVSAEEREELVDALSRALNLMIVKTCPNMAPLWVRATLRARRLLSDGQLASLPFEPTGRYLRLSKGQKSKYRTLAAWRHAVLWRTPWESLDADFARALRAIYFTRWPSNEPPYAFSQSASEAPAVGGFENATQLAEWAKEGAWQSLDVLLDHQADERRDGSVAAEVREAILACATRRSAMDVLKLDAHFDPPRSLEERLP